MRNKEIGFERATKLRERYINEDITVGGLARSEGLEHNTVAFVLRNWTYKDSKYGDLYSKYERQRRRL